MLIFELFSSFSSLQVGQWEVELGGSWRGKGRASFTDEVVAKSYRTSSVGDPLHFGADADPDPSSDPHRYLLLSDPDSGGAKTYGFGTRVHLHHSSKEKKSKKLLNSRNQGFSYYFFLMMEGSGAGSGLVTNGSECGSGRPKNIRIVIRIPNTAHINCLTYF